MRNIESLIPNWKPLRGRWRSFACHAFTLVVTCSLNSVSMTAQDDELAHWTESQVFEDLEEAAEARRNGVPIFRLDLSKQRRSEIPAEILEWTELREVILDRNRLKSIGPELKQLVFLERFAVNSNQLEHFPTVLTQMPHLKTLEMGDNMIDSIPLNIDRIEALESLELWDNVLAYFPASLSDLPNLHRLDLLHNDMVFEEQEALRNWLPSHVELILSAPCRCDFDE